MVSCRKLVVNQNSALLVYLHYDLHNPLLYSVVFRNAIPKKEAEMGLVIRFFRANTDSSYFLFGARGTGKPTLIKKIYYASIPVENFLLHITHNKKLIKE